MQRLDHSNVEARPLTRDAGDAVAPPAQPNDLGEELRDLWWALWSRGLLIAAIVAVAVLLCLVYLRLATPIYTANTDIFIDPRQKELTGGEVVPSGLGSSALGADTALVESQVAIMSSESVINGVISGLALDQDAEFVGGETSSPTGNGANLMRLILYGEAERYERSPYDEAKRKLLRRLDIERLGNTYVIRIEARSEDPDKAASIANLVADIYTAESRNYNSSSTQAAADDVSGRLDELRQTMQEAARAVEEFREANGLVGAQNVLVSEQQLFEVNRNLSDAQVAARVARSNLDQARRALADPLSGDLTGLESPLAISLLGRLADARSEEATLRTRLLPRHPRLTDMAEQIASIESEVRAELERVVSRYENAYNVARQNEDALRAQVEALQEATAASNTDIVRLRELELEADLSREIYEDFRARSNQINEEVGLQPSNTRIVSTAYAASRPAHPRGPLLLAAAIAGGLIAGCFLAWCLHIVNGTERKPRRTTPANPLIAPRDSADRRPGDLDPVLARMRSVAPASRRGPK